MITYELDEMERRVLEGVRDTAKVASMATVRAAVADILDAGWQCAKGCDIKHAWRFYPDDESELETANRERFINAVAARITRLQSPPHLFDVVVMGKLRDSRAEYKRGYSNGWEDAMKDQEEVRPR